MIFLITNDIAIGILYETQTDIDINHNHQQSYCLQSLMRFILLIYDPLNLLYCL